MTSTNWWHPSEQRKDLLKKDSKAVWLILLERSWLVKDSGRNSSKKRLFDWSVWRETSWWKDYCGISYSNTQNFVVNKLTEKVLRRRKEQNWQFVYCQPLLQGLAKARSPERVPGSDFRWVTFEQFVLLSWRRRLPLVKFWQKTLRCPGKICEEFVLTTYPPESQSKGGWNGFWPLIPFRAAGGQIRA